MRMIRSPVTATSGSMRWRADSKHDLRSILQLISSQYGRRTTAVLCSTRIGKDITIFIRRRRAEQVRKNFFLNLPSQSFRRTGLPTGDSLCILSVTRKQKRTCGYCRFRAIGNRFPSFKPNSMKMLLSSHRICVGSRTSRMSPGTMSYMSVRLWSGQSDRYHQTRKWQVSTNGVSPGNSNQWWNRNGKELFYLSSDNKMMVAGSEGKRIEL